MSRIRLDDRGLKRVPPSADRRIMDGAGRFAVILLCALAPLAAACGTGIRAHPVAAPSGPAGGRAVASTALDLVGVPYRPGGSDPTVGFDCSGLVAYVFARLGYSVPRVVEQQFDVGRRIKADQIRPGDLLFFETSGRGPTHVAIALDRESFVHAPKEGGAVRIERLSSSYWSRRFLAARRWL
ncbi:MAG: C40 family peptidase [Acidobacteriota bacterium]